MVRGTLKAYHRQGAYQAGKGYAYSGGDLNIVTPLLTGEPVRPWPTRRAAA